MTFRSPWIPQIMVAGYDPLLSLTECDSSQDILTESAYLSNSQDSSADPTPRSHALTSSFLDLHDSESPC